MSGYYDFFGRYYGWIILGLIILSTHGNFVGQRIIRIKTDLIRCPLWCLYFPLVVVFDMIPSAIMAKRNIFERRFWNFTWLIFLVGFDGMFCEDE